MKTKDHEFQPILEAQVEIAQQRGIEVPFGEIASNAIGGIVAGTDTTGIAIGVGLWSIFSNESIRKRLHDELVSTWSDEQTHPSLQSLEALPYLRACVSESLRFASPISGRLPRVVPQSGLRVDGHYLPPSTRVSSSSYLVHFDKNVFKDPYSFNPERWLNGAPEKYLVPFSTGSRACMGSNLAQAEIYTVLGAVIRWYVASEMIDTGYEWYSMLSTSFPQGLNVKLTKNSA